MQIRLIICSAMTIPNQETIPLILLVEDNIIALRLVETIVAQAGCRHISATDGEQALALTKTGEFDLIITDLGLPGIAGSELTSQIRAWEKAENKKHIPIIGLTAHKLHDSESLCLQAGMDKVLSKPIYLDEMQKLMVQFIKKNTWAQMALEKFPLFDQQGAMKNIGDFAMLKDLLGLMINQAIPEDMASIQEAYKNQNWQQVKDLAHKIKSGALYCGTKRMQHACHNLEHYLQIDNLDLTEKLYQQLIITLTETKAFLETWLAKN